MSRQIIVAGNNSRRPLFGIARKYQVKDACQNAGLGFRIPADVGIIVRKPIRLQGIPVSPFTKALSHIHVVAQRGSQKNPLMPPEHQIIHRFLYSAVNIRSHSHNIALQEAVVPGLVEYYRDSGPGNLIQLGGRIAVGQHEHPVKAPFDQRLNKFVSITAVTVGYEIAPVKEFLLRNLQPVVPQIVADKSNLHGLVGFQASGVKIRPVLKFLNRPSHRLGLFLTDKFRLVDDIGNYRRRHPSQFCHIVSCNFFAHFPSPFKHV